VIAGLLTAVRDAVGRLGVEGLREELDGLAAVLETHFIGEEKRLVGVLNAIDPSEGLTGLTA
jgi:hypothetical protein